MYPPPEIIAARPFASLPERFKGRRDSSWGRINFAAHALTSFLEGPSFDRSGNLYVVDIPFGRIFRIRPDAAWDLVAEYDGWPNGLKVHPDGYLVVADYRRGILRVDPATGAAETMLDSYRCEGFKGCNDLYFGPDGALYFTDQGQTGLQDPTGRVYRWSETRGLDCLIGTIPSPNGLVLNRGLASAADAGRRRVEGWSVRATIRGRGRAGRSRPRHRGRPMRLSRGHRRLALRWAGPTDTLGRGAGRLTLD